MEIVLVFVFAFLCLASVPLTTMLAALVVVDTFGGPERAISVDESAVGLLAAAGALALRLPMIAVAAIAAAVTAGLRLI